MLDLTTKRDREKYPELFIPDSNVDPRTRTRTVPMEILNLSMSRTGTNCELKALFQTGQFYSTLWRVALQVALEILGYGPIIHGFNLFNQLRDVAMWREGLELKYSGSLNTFGRKEFDNLLGGYEVASDVPIIGFSEELIKAYPEAKVIIVEREIESWYRSFNDTIIDGLFSPVYHAVLSLDPPLNSYFGSILIWAKGTFKASSEKEVQENAREAYKEHYRLIRHVTPKERLLDFQLQEGWEPLCNFLGKEVPDVPFPRVNEKDSFDEKLVISMKQALTRVLKKFSPFVGGAAVVIFSWMLFG